MMMNKMREIYGVVNMILFPEDEDPEMLSLELFSSFAKAKERSEEIIKEFIDDYGEDYIEHATKKNPVAVMGNGDVTGYVVEKKNTGYNIKKEEKFSRNFVKTKK